MSLMALWQNIWYDFTSGSSVTAAVGTQQMRWKTLSGWQSSHVQKTGNEIWEEGHLAALHLNNPHNFSKSGCILAWREQKPQPTTEKRAQSIIIFLQESQGSGVGENLAHLFLWRKQWWCINTLSVITIGDPACKGLSDGIEVTRKLAGSAEKVAKPKVDKPQGMTNLTVQREMFPSFARVLTDCNLSRTPKSIRPTHSFWYFLVKRGTRLCTNPGLDKE